MKKNSENVPFYQHFVAKKNDPSRKTHSSRQSDFVRYGKSVRGKSESGGARAYVRQPFDRSTLKMIPAAHVSSAGTLFTDISAEAAALLSDFDDIVQSVMPLSPSQKAELPRHIRALSHGLTDERSGRNSGYMNTPVIAGAYIRYYMWWNLVRFVRLFSGLPFVLKNGDYAVDIGSGPLTVVCALWIARPELRSFSLTWYCIDESSSILSSGEELFLSLVARTGGVPWNIVRIKGGPQTQLHNRVALVTCANMMNELFWDNKEPMEVQAKTQVTNLTNCCASECAVLIIEPGIPRSARFISLMRDSLMKKKFMPLSPCPHTASCPMNGVKGGKWCHFVFPTTQAPRMLQKRSAESGIPKDKLALSFIYASRGEEKAHAADLSVRIASDAISLPGGRTGRYGCCCDGLMLLQFSVAQESPESGNLVTLPADTDVSAIDKKSGARTVLCTSFCGSQNG